MGKKAEDGKGERQKTYNIIACFHSWHPVRIVWALWRLGSSNHISLPTQNEITDHPSLTGNNKSEKKFQKFFVLFSCIFSRLERLKLYLTRIIGIKRFKYLASIEKVMPTLHQRELKFKWGLFCQSTRENYLFLVRVNSRRKYILDEKVGQNSGSILLLY